MAGPRRSQAELAYVSELRSWRKRRDLTQKVLAEAISYDPSRISHIEAGRQAPTEEFTRQVEAILRTGGALWDKWEAIASERFHSVPRRPERDLRSAEFIGWLADAAGQPYQTIYSAVSALASRLEAEPASARHAADHARRSITRQEIAGSVARYYGSPQGDQGFYAVNVDGRVLRTSVLIEPDWLNIAVQLGTDEERVRYLPTAPPIADLDNVAVNAAIRRLASVELASTVMINNPLYRLLDIEVSSRTLTASVGPSEFAAYALTSDLLEEELLGAIHSATDPAAPLPELPLRRSLLPDLHAATDFDHRLCVGGVVALTAIARQPKTGRPDYLLLTQLRSSAVLNATGRLAVIPKAFHQPTREPSREAGLSVTLDRELEEELLGREDLEQLATTGSRQIAPLHPRGVSEPMAWLTERRGTGAFRSECTGFGINLVTGNYEVAALVVIGDDDWWDRFGHLVQSNWEAERVQCVSSLETDALAALASDPRWSNEGLFAFLQGVRRLAQLDTTGRVAAPAITLEA